MTTGDSKSSYDLPAPEPNPVKERLMLQRLCAKLLGEQSMWLGRYELEHELGSGGMGMVYLARDSHLERQVAIKFLMVQDLAEQHLLAEARAMAKVTHPNVVRVYDCDSADGLTFIVMEYVEGGTLERWLKQQPHALEPILEMFCAAGEGLAAAHDKGLVHRDFKPANVL
ncbi:MAG: serine/threonine protein kinase, partial [Myxococcales bacterium]|nr:serine/threonine protein kinase [Myxococcales bacterium]